MNGQSSKFDFRISLNNPLYSPLALVIIGGLLSSTILTRVVTPVLYKLLAPRIQTDAPAPQ